MLKSQSPSSCPSNNKGLRTPGSGLRQEKRFFLEPGARSPSSGARSPDSGLRTPARKEILSGARSPESFFWSPEPGAWSLFLGVRVWSLESFFWSLEPGVLLLEPGARCDSYNRTSEQYSLEVDGKLSVIRPNH